MLPECRCETDPYLIPKRKPTATPSCGRCRTRSPSPRTHLEWFKSTTERFREEISVFGNFPTLFMGIVKKDNGLTFYDGNLRIVDASGHIVAQQLDPADYASYIGEKVDPGLSANLPTTSPRDFPTASTAWDRWRA